MHSSRRGVLAAAADVADSVRIHALAACGSDARVAREVFRRVERRDLRHLARLVQRRPDIPWKRSWGEGDADVPSDALALRSSLAHQAPDGRTPLMAALLATARHQLVALAGQPAALQAMSKGAPHSLAGLTAARALEAKAAPGPAWGAVARAAAAEWREDAALVLLFVGGPRLATQSDAAGRTALHYAAAAGDADTTVRLRRLGANATAKDRQGRGAAHFAAARGHAELARSLVEGGSQKDVFGHTVEGILSRHAELRETAEVPRRSAASGLTTHDVLCEFVAAGIPVLLEGGAAHLPAMRMWGKPEVLAAKLGDTLLSAGPVPYPASMGLFGREVKLADFETCSGAAQTAGAVPDYIFDVTVTRRMPELLSDAELLPPALFDAGDGLAKVAYARHPQLGVGPRGAGAPMHAHFAALNALFSGAKRWLLVPPEETFWGVSPASTWAASGEPAALRARGALLEVTQHPGDLLFVPEGWGHATVLEEYGVGIGQEFIAESSIFS